MRGCDGAPSVVISEEKKIGNVRKREGPEKSHRKLGDERGDGQVFCCFAWICPASVLLKEEHLRHSETHLYSVCMLACSHIVL